MMLANRYFKAVLLTTHIALRDVPSKVTKEEIYRKLKLTSKYFPKKKIGVCALNPHGGEGGLFGDEEIKEIKPGIDRAKMEGIPAFGPYPADTLFVRTLKGEFDVVLSMYHDQALIPIKLVGFGESVNVTLGLPIIRTSVDHGTAYDIAGKGIAKINSFLLAIKMAKSLIGNLTNLNTTF